MAWREGLMSNDKNALKKTLYMVIYLEYAITFLKDTHKARFNTSHKVKILEKTT